MLLNQEQRKVYKNTKKKNSRPNEMQFAVEWICEQKILVLALNRSGLWNYRVSCTRTSSRNLMPTEDGGNRFLWNVRNHAP